MELVVTPTVRAEKLVLPRFSPTDSSDTFELTGYADTSLTDEVDNMDIFTFVVDFVMLICINL